MSIGWNAYNLLSGYGWFGASLSNPAILLYGHQVNDLS
jgi:hypothetical protein